MSNKADIADEPVGATFREKSLWATLVSTLVIYAYYFVRVVQLGDGEPVRVASLFVQTVIGLIAIQVIVTAALAIHRKPERADERDRRVALVATRNSYYVLMTGVWGALGVASLSLGTFWVAHAGLLAVVIAELARCGTQLVLYRRGLA